jgi:hypothetical protein
MWKEAVVTHLRPWFFIYPDGLGEMELNVMKYDVRPRLEASTSRLQIRDFGTSTEPGSAVV